MRDVLKFSSMDTVINPRERKNNFHSDTMEHRIECFKNALDNIRQICKNETIRPKMKLTLIETISRLTIGLNDD